MFKSQTFPLLEELNLRIEEISTERLYENVTIKNYYNCLNVSKHSKYPILKRVLIIFVDKNVDYHVATEILSSFPLLEYIEIYGCGKEQYDHELH